MEVRASLGRPVVATSVPFVCLAAQAGPGGFVLRSRLGALLQAHCGPLERLKTLPFPLSLAPGDGRPRGRAAKIFRA